MIFYAIQPGNPQAHLFTVTMRIAHPDPAGQLLRMPAWIPGSYMVRDFARNVVSLTAQCGGEPLAVAREDKSTWRCAPCDGELQVEYEVYAWELSVRAAHLDTTHGFFNGTSVFLEVVGQAERACQVDILPPRGEAYAHWRVATSLSLAGAAPYGFGAYRAEDYADLVDHPVEMGEFSLASFEAGGVPHDIVITGRHQADMPRLCADLQRICEHHQHFFGLPAPMSRYVFLLMVTADGYGGLEHRASTALLSSRKSLPRPGAATVTADYRELLGLCSHEYFHTWNVKRIKPAAFVPQDLRAEQHTRLLWAFEGITSYYDDLALVRCGLIQPESYLELLARVLSRVQRNPGRFKQNLADSSFDAWTRFYKQDENAPNAIVSYYTKGTLVALCLDVLIRQCSEERYSLDDLLRLLWQRYGCSPQGSAGVAETAIEQAVEELLGEAHSARVQAFFAHALRSTANLDMESALAYLGVRLQWTAPRHQNDWGGYTASPVPEAAPQSSLGVRAVAAQGFAKISHVYADSSAARAGLAAGDLLVAVDGLQARANTLEATVAAYPVGTHVVLTAFRRDELISLTAELQAAVPSAARLSWLAVHRERSRRWLGLDA